MAERSKPHGPVPKSMVFGPVGGWRNASRERQTAGDSMNPIRVHLGPMPRMLRTMISDLLTAEPDITVVGNSFNDQDSLSAASAQNADVLIAQERASVAGTGTAAVLSGTPSAVLAVAADGHDGTCVNLIRRPVRLNGDGSLPDAVRKLLSESGCVRNHDSLEG